MIIAIKQADRVVVGYTVDAWYFLTEQDCIDPENIAIKFTQTGQMLVFGRPDSYADLFMYDEHFADMAATPKTIVRDMIPYIKRKLKENYKPLSKSGSWYNALIICDNAHIYSVGSKFDFREEVDYVAIGPVSISETLKSVIDATTSLPAEERMIKAVEVATKVHKQILFPLVITDTKTKQFKVIYQGE